MSETPLIGIGAVFPASSITMRDTLVRAIEKSSGIAPIAKRKNDGVSRALYAPALARVIINFSSTEILERLGNPSAAMALTVENPKEASQIAKKVMEDAGHSARIMDAIEIELGIPEGFMYFLLSDTFVPIIFWPALPTTANVAGVVPPEEWSYGS